MKGYWTKNRSWISILFSIILGALMAINFNFSTVSRINSSYDENSIYIQSDIDLIVPSPSFEQVNEFNNKAHNVESACGYYFNRGTVKIGSNTLRKNNILIFDNADNLEITMYNNSRLLSKKDTDKAEAYVDEAFAKRNNVNLGDNVTYVENGANRQFVISKIFETNTMYEEGTIVLNNAKNTVEYVSTLKGYSGAFVKASDYSGALSYFKTDYRPLARLRDRSEFPTDKEYNDYNDTVRRENVANEITDFAGLKNTALKSFDNVKSSSVLYSIVGSIVGLVLIIVFDLLIQLRKSELHFFNTVKNKKEVKSYYIKSFVIEFLIEAIIGVGGSFLAVSVAGLPALASGISLFPLITLGALLIGNLITLIIALNKKAVKEN